MLLGGVLSALLLGKHKGIGAVCPNLLCNNSFELDTCSAQDCAGKGLSAVSLASVAHALLQTAAFQ